MRDFDIVVVGSGPTATAVLDGLSRNRTIAVVTGEGFAPVPGSDLQAKILAVSRDSGQPAGLTDPITAEGQTLFATAMEGGLANYWGQQLVRQAENDPWPTSLFGSFEQYEKECEAIERLFALRGGEPIDTGVQESLSDFSLRRPRLLVGTREDPSLGLDSMRATFQQLSQDVHRFATRAERLERSPSGWAIHLSDGRRIGTRTVILAAGVIGTAQLLMRTWPDLIAARFGDHVPYMVYTLGLRRLIESRPADVLPHFNALSVELLREERCTLFASVYDMTRTGLNLLLASTIGQAFRSLRRWPAPPGIGFVQPVQAWTPRTVGTIELTARQARLESQADDPGADPDLQSLLRALRAQGGRILLVKATSPGHGFHYHALKLRSEGAEGFVDISSLLARKSDGSIICADASILPTIGCRPHTLTAMAVARQTASTLKQR